MAATDDALHAYLGRTDAPASGNNTYTDTGSRGMSGYMRGGQAWYNDTGLGRRVLDFSDSTADAGFDDDPSVIMPGPFAVGGGDFSVAGWIYFVSSPVGNGRLVSTHYASSIQGWAIVATSGRHVKFTARDTSTYDELFCSTILGTGAWHAFVLTWDDSEKEPRMYFNDSESSYYSGQGPTDFSVTGSIERTITRVENGFPCLGISAMASSNTYRSEGLTNSYMLGPCIWDRILTSGEITELTTMPDVPTTSSGGAALYGTRMKVIC